jgi:uncharacterized protein YabN with tetrapyrrole methylase and pyrophosphatase domain
VPAGALTIVGTGIAAGAHLTSEARAALQGADEVLYLVPEPVAAAMLESLNPNSRSLFGFYRPGLPRREIYRAIAAEIVEPVRAGKQVCVAFYGHPGVFVRPAHEAVRIARAEGFAARMLPAVSALDCLFADVGIDPADTGLQTYEATEFLLHARTPDSAAGLVLWQLHVIGQERWGDAGKGLALLAEYLGRWYPAGHETIVYEASPFPIGSATVERVPLGELARRTVPAQSTLYVPPAREPQVDPEMAARLGRRPP